MEMETKATTSTKWYGAKEQRDLVDMYIYYYAYAQIAEGSAVQNL